MTGISRIVVGVVIRMVEMMEGTIRRATMVKLSLIRKTFKLQVPRTDKVMLKGSKLAKLHQQRKYRVAQCLDLANNVKAMLRTSSTSAQAKP